MRLGVSLALTQPWASSGGGASPTYADITSFRILASTDALDATGDYGDATTRPGVNGAGWVAEVVMPYLAATTFDPSKLVIETSDPGYDANGDATTVTRTFRCGRILRRQYNAATSKMSANDGITLTAYVSVNQPIYAGTTVTSVTAEAWYYGVAQEGDVSSVTNDSDFAYPKPTGFAWLNAQHEHAYNSSTFDVECVVFHRHMRNGRQVACVKFFGYDSQGTPNTSATQTAGSTSLSDFQTQGNIAEAWKASIPLTNLTQADLCFVNAKVYPWIGDSTAVLDLVADGENPTGDIQTANPCTPLRFLNDKNGTYGGAHIAVKGGASGTVAYSNYADAVANPCGSYATALAALRTYNNANKGHNDHSGSFLWLMEDSSGAGANFVLNNVNVSAVAAGKCYTTIDADPAATGQITIELSTGTSGRTADLLRWGSGLKFNHTGGTGLDGGSTTNWFRACFDGCTIDLTGTAASTSLTQRVGVHYLRNTTWINPSSVAGAMPGNSSNTTLTRPGLWLGVICTDYVSKAMPQHAMIGCRFRGMYLSSNNYSTNPNWSSQDKSCIYNNELYETRSANNVIATNATTGYAVVQNVIEPANRATSVAGVVVAGDVPTECYNLVWAYNTIPGTDGGSRFNTLYTDDASSVGQERDGAFLYNLFYEFNIKTDTQTAVSTALGRTTNWKARWGNEVVGNVVINGASDGTQVPSDNGSNNFLADYFPPENNNETYAGAGVTFTDNKSGLSGAGFGTYTLTGASNDAYDRVPSGMAGLGKALNGATRLNDGTGAAGAYERP